MHECFMDLEYQDNIQIKIMGLCDLYRIRLVGRGGTPIDVVIVDFYLTFLIIAHPVLK